MSEFGLRHPTNQPFQPGGVDWYTPSASANYGNYPSTYNAPSTQTYGNAGPSGSFEDEPPLLEELGIDVGAILGKTRAVLLYRLKSRALDDLDMGGALIFIFVLGGLHLLMGKLHFGVILGWSVVHSVLVWFLVSQLAGAEGAEAKGLDLYSCCSVVGYCMLPLVVYSALALLIPRGLVSIVLAAFCTVWSAVTASRIFARRCPALEDLKSVIMYPCLLTYGAFALLSVY